MKNIPMLTSAILLALSSTSVTAQDDDSLTYTDAGIPILQTNPGAPVAIYLDFDGGVYSYDGEVLSGYNRNSDEGSDGNPLTFDAAEQKDIINAVNNVDEYFSMFDVNVTTDISVRQNSTAAAWIIITQDYAGGKGYVGGSGISVNPEYARGYSAGDRSRIEASNKNRTVASELGHNFGLKHQGVCTNGTFQKLVDSPSFDGQRGAVMGSGGGLVNGWRYGDHDGSNTCVDLQDDLQVIQKRILAVAGSEYTGDGYRVDDHLQAHDETATPIQINSDMNWTASGIIERSADKDSFRVEWSGGDMHIVATPKGVSAVDVIVRLFDSESNLVAEVNTDNINMEYLPVMDLAAGNYYIDVMSHGGYGELGAYNLLIQDESAGPPSSGRIEVAIDHSSDDAEESSAGKISRSSSDLELVFDGDNQVVGLKFNQINIPQNAKINNAYIQFQADETNSEETLLTIHGELNSTPFTYSSSTNNITNRQQTFSSVEWAPTPWVFKGERGVAQRTENLKELVQEIVNLNTWIPSDSMAFMISGTGKRVAESFNGSLPGAPTLIIEYGDYDSTVPVEEPDDGEENDTVIENPGNEISTYTATSVIETSGDDVEERASGYISASSSDLELVQDSDTQLIGLRFSNLQVPQNAIITNAYVQFTAHTANNEPTELIISAEETGHAASFNKTSFNVSNRILNSEHVLWSPEPWYFSGDAEVEQQTPDLSSVIQPLVTNTDWYEGNSVVLVISGEGKRVATSFDSNPDLAPILIVNYQLPEEEPVNTLTKIISSSQDDVEERITGDISTSSSDLEMVVDGDTQVIGLRFTDLNLPENARVVDARIQFQADETDNGSTLLELTAELSGNSLPILSEPYNLSNRVSTNNQIIWNVNAWSQAHESGADQLSPNIADLINEVLSQSTWSEGSAITFIIKGEGKRVATAFDNNPSAAPKLIITYR